MKISKQNRSKRHQPSRSLVLSQLSVLAVVLAQRVTGLAAEVLEPSRAEMVVYTNILEVSLLEPAPSELIVRDLPSSYRKPGHCSLQQDEVAHWCSHSSRGRSTQDHRVGR